MKKIILTCISVFVFSLAARAANNADSAPNHQDSAGSERNTTYKKDASMETKSTADHSGQDTRTKETNADGKKKSTKQGPRTMQNTMPGTNSTPVPHN
jgi:hypothetical protein